MRSDGGGRRKPAVLLTLATLCGAVLPEASTAATYYVDGANASDTAAGTTAATAYHSFAKAMTALAPGDHLMIAAGRYDEPLRITVSGNARAPLVIEGAAGALPVIVAASDAVSVEADYVTLSRVNAASTGPMGSAIVVQAGHHHVTISHVIAHDSGCAGIAGLQTDYIAIRHNVVYGNGRSSPWQCSGISLYQAADFDTAPGFHNVIADNIVYRNVNLVPDPKLTGPSAGHTTDGNGIIIDDFRHTQTWRGQRTPAYSNSTLVENNVAFDNGGRGIQVFFSDHVTVRNNTVYRNLQDRRLLGTAFGEIQVVSSTAVTVANNLIVPSQDHGVGLLAVDTNSVVADYNVSIGERPPYDTLHATLAWGAHNHAGRSPGFRIEGSGELLPDLHLTTASDALGRADPAQAPAEDLDGRSRTRARHVDAGAYQLSE